jgi:hypothetical protein
VSKKADKPGDKAADNGKGKKGKDKKGKGELSGGASVASHPRARASVRRAKGWGGLIGFGIAAFLSFKAGVPAPDAGLRALGAGLVGYILAWACAVAVWRHLVVAEMRAAYERAAQHGLTPAAAGTPSGGRGTPSRGSGTPSTGSGATGDRR